MKITEELKNAVSQKKFTLPLPTSTLNAIQEAKRNGTMLSYDDAKAVMTCVDFNAEDEEEAYYVWWKDSIFRDVLPLHPDVYYRDK